MLIASVIPFFAFQILISIYFPFYFRKRINGLVAALWAYALVLCVFHGFSPLWEGKLTLVQGEIYRMLSAARLWAILFITPAAALICSQRIEQNLVGLISSFLVVDAFYLFGKFNGTMGLMNQTSFDITAMAIVLPFLISKESKIKCIASAILFLAIIMLPGSTAKICVLASVLAYCFARRHWRAFWSVAILALAGFVFIKDFTYTSGRLEVWQIFARQFWDQANIWTGFGPGSFKWISFVQEIHRTRYVMLHNDYLQVFFETGIIGGSLFVLTVVCSLWRLKNDPIYFPSAAAFAVAMIAYFPLHFLQTSIIGLFLIRRALQKGNSFAN